MSDNEEANDARVLSESVAREREARKTRRRLERERQLHASEARRVRRINVDCTTVSGSQETRSQREARTSSRVAMSTDSRQIVSTLLSDGSLRTEVFGAANGTWKSLGFIELQAPSHVAPTGLEDKKE